MAISDDDSVLAVVVPVLGGLVGLLLGPFGLLSGAGVPLVIGADVRHAPAEERIAEIERRVEELEDAADT